MGRGDVLGYERVEPQAVEGQMPLACMQPCWEYRWGGLHPRGRVTACGCCWNADKELSDMKTALTPPTGRFAMYTQGVGLWARTHSD